LDDSLLAGLGTDPAIRKLNARVSGDVQLDGATKVANVFSGRITLTGVDKANDAPLGWMRLEKGRWFNPGEAACVIDQNMAETSKLKVGDLMKTRGANGPLELPVVGIIHKPGLFSGFSQTCYAPLEQVQKFLFGTDRPNRYSTIRIQFKPGTNGDDFVGRWTPRLKLVDGKAKLKLTRQTRDDMTKNFVGLRLLSMLAGSVTLLAAAFIIIATLSMGVAERQRTLAMLRAVGLSKSRLFRMVVIEGIGLGVVGILIGVPLGFFISLTVAFIIRRWFEIEPTLDWLGIVGATAITLVTAVLSSLVPAWQASRVDPLEAMAAIARPPRLGPPWKATVLGLLLASADYLVLHAPLPEWIGKDVRVYGHFVVGLPLMMIGFFMLAPMFVWVTGRLFGPLIAWLLNAPADVVRQQFVSGLWRLAGTCAALMVGLAVLVVMQVQGKSALASWKLPDKFPDIFIFTKSRLTPQQQALVADSPMLKREDVMAVGTFNPVVGGGLLGMLSTQLPGATMFVAVDPSRAFRLMELEFRQGSPQEASVLLAKGHHVLITEELHRMKNLNKGDPFVLKNSKNQAITFTVAGVVWSPGIDVMVSTFDVQQQFEQQSLACVFGSLDDAKNLFGEENVYIMSANFKEVGTSKDVLIESLRDSLNDRSLFVADVRQLKSQIETGMGNLLLAASVVAWAALAVASLGVANTIIAGIRTRMWQFGILRSVGLLRGVLLRVVLAEAILLGLTGVAMGLACGAVLTIDSRRLVELTIGHHSKVVVPWNVIGIGVGSIIVLSLLAAIVPAWRLSRTEPLTLLQAGRSAA
jgi:putative ABC transport system permease protein